MSQIPRPEPSSKALHRQQSGQGPAQAPQKRPVARRACLACRDKKVKCDGEALTTSDGAEGTHQQCSNCKMLGIECVFVKSQRGGRRRGWKDASHDAEVLSDTTKSARSSSVVTSVTSPRMVYPARSQFEPPPSIMSGGTSPFYHNGNNSPIPPSSERGSSSSHSLQEKVQQLQRQAANLQSQILEGGGSIPTSSAGSDYYPDHGPPPHHRPRDFFDRPPRPWDHHHRPPPPHHHHYPPPPPPWASGEGPLHPPFGGPHHHPMPMHPGAGGPLPPPPGPFPFSSFDDEARRKRPHPSQESDFSLPKLSHSMSYIVIPDEELEAFDLPSWKITCILIDLYYRYIHPSRPFLPPKHRLIYQFQVRQDASLLHAMFTSACRFASSMMIPSQNLRDPQHWYFLAEKYWDFMDANTALQAHVLLMGALGPGGFVQQSIDGSERTYQVMLMSNLLEGHKITDWKAYANIATKKQVLSHEDALRTIWGSWKLNVFLRLNRGMPYNKLSDKLLEFPADLPLPLSDSLYNFNLGIFNTTENQILQRLNHKLWKDVSMELTYVDPSRVEQSTLTDSDLIIAAIKYIEEIMDVVSSGFLDANTVVIYNKKIETLEAIARSSLFQISHIKRKTLVLNISKLFALLILSMASLTSNATQCSSILFIKPHETSSNSNPDNVVNSLYKSKLEDIFTACLELTPNKVLHYVRTFLAAIEAVRLIEIGMGKIPEADSSNGPIPVVGGPLNFKSAAEISSMKTNESWWTDAIPEQGKTMSAQVQTYNEFPDVWLQYPIFSVVVIANALTALASSVILTRKMSVKLLPDDRTTPNDMCNVEFCVGNMQHIVVAQMKKAEYEVFGRAFNTMDLHEKMTLCSKFIKAHGRFWPYVETTSFQIDEMINYIDDLI